MSLPKLKIVNITSSTYFPQINGLSLMSQIHVQSLIQLGYTVNVFTSCGCQSRFGENIFTYNFKGNGRLFNPIRGEKHKYLTDLIEHSKFSIVNVYHGWHSWPTTLALSCEEIKAKQIVYSHGTGFMTFEPLVRRLIRRVLYYFEKKRLDQFLSKIDGIITITSNTKHPRCYDLKVLAPHKKKYLLPNTILDRVLSPHVFDDSEMLELNSSHPVCLNVSNFEKIKNQKFLIDLFREGNLGKLILVASEKTKYYYEIINYIRIKNLEDIVSIHIGLDDFTTDYLYKNCDLFLFASQNDFAPLVLIEAAKNGLPFISFETADTALKGGVFVSTPEEYKKELIQLLTNKEERNYHSSTGLDYYSRYHSTNAYFKGVEEIFNNFL